MRFRQVHLDFHTSECIPDIGKRFDKKQFQDALRTGHVDSITVFSKCHHGWSYHPTKANRIHPELSFDGVDGVVSQLVPPKKAALVELNMKALSLGKDFKG